MSSKINLQTCEYACKSSIFQDNQLILFETYRKFLYPSVIFQRIFRFLPTAAFSLRMIYL